MEEQIKKATKLLESHDFWYMMSDDFRVWSKGLDSYAEVCSALSKLPAETAVRLWDEHAPQQLRGIYTKFEEVKR